MPRFAEVQVSQWLSTIIAAALLMAPFLITPTTARADYLSMSVKGRLRNFSTEQRYEIDILDRDIYSPKSARFAADGKKLYVNSLEGGATVVYAWPSLKKITTIRHRFDKDNQVLFNGETTAFDLPYFAESPTGNPNIFTGKPVESELSHGGRYLWIPYYRRSFDTSAQSPSAVAIIDTQIDRIIRVMPTGPIPKYVAVSPDGRTMAITHWGNNTIGLIDISSNNPAQFRYKGLLTVETALDQSKLAGTDRDKTCGFCLRGTVFTSDSRYLLVARMGGGGIAGFDADMQTYLGTVLGVAPTPRHLELTPDGARLFASSNQAGVVSVTSTQALIQSLLRAGGRRVAGPRWKTLDLGSGARTIALDPTGKVVFVALNTSSELVAVHTSTLQEIGRVAVDPFAVGLAISPDGSAAVVTSQGIDGKGGNSVAVISLKWGDEFNREPVDSAAPVPLR